MSNKLEPGSVAFLSIGYVYDIGVPHARAGSVPCEQQAPSPLPGAITTSTASAPRQV
jgi:hypothetical protein